MAEMPRAPPELQLTSLHPPSACLTGDLEDSPITDGGGRMQERREKWRKGERKGCEAIYARPLQPVCFRSALKDYPFISPHILVSVVTQREARRALS